MAPNTDPDTPRLRSRARAYALLASLSVLWGLAFVAIRSAEFELSPLSLLLLRWLIASAGFAAILPFARSKTRFERRDIPRLVAFALLSVVLYGLFLNNAETSIPAGLAGLFNSLGPVLMVAFSAMALKERVSRRLMYALLLAILGSVILWVGDLNVHGASIVGAVEAILAATVYAGFTVLSKPLVVKYGALSVTIWGALIGTAFLLPVASGAFLSQVSVLSASGWAAVLFLSLLVTVVGYTMFYTLVGRGPVSTLSVQLYLIPIVSVAGGVLILSEQLTFLVVVGGAVILLAVGLARTNKAQDGLER